MSVLRKDLEFQIISWYKQDEEENEDKSTDDSDSDSDSSEEDNWKKKKKNNKDSSKFKIYIFGKDLDEKTYTLKWIYTYFYIKFPIIVINRTLNFGGWVNKMVV